MRKIFVKKFSGKKELYKREKLVNSLIKAGIAPDFIERIIDEVEKRLYNGISTYEIHRIVLEVLKKEVGIYYRYNLKRALFSLGPTGFPFEKFVARILEEYGYKTQTDVVLMGKCVSHEIDVLAVKKDKFWLVECKFHNSAGVKTNVKVPLYIKSRVEDILDNKENKDVKRRIGGVWIFTNTKFTLDAISYAECKGIRITAWSYPKGRNIQSIIEKYSLYPITIFDDINFDVIKASLESGIITVKDFYFKRKLAKEIFGEDYPKVLLAVTTLLNF